MDDLVKIRAFIDVVENGSFSAAARKQDVSISSIARRIAALEDELGLRLVNRNTRSLSVTEAGQVYYERTRDALRNLEQARFEAVSFQDEVKGLLRVSLRISVGVMVLARLGAFLQSHPGLTIDLDLTDERPDLLRNNIDVAVWVGQLRDSELIARQLHPGSRVLCASPDYLERHGEPGHPEDLAQHSCLTFHAPDYDGTWQFRQGDERWEIKGEGPFVSTSGLALKSAALSGMGLVVLQRYMIRDELAAGSLRAVMTDHEVYLSGTDAGIYAIYPHSRHLAPKARAFIDFLIECFREI